MLLHSPSFLVMKQGHRHTIEYYEIYNHKILGLLINQEHI